MKIRPASLQDLEDIQALYKALIADMARLQPAYFQPTAQDEAFIRSVLESEAGDILLATEDHRVLGFALVQEQTTPPYPCFVFHRYAYLMDIVTAPGHRGKGVGKALLRAAEEWATLRKCEYIELSVLTENQGGIALYEKTGFKEYTKVMRKSL